MTRQRVYPTGSTAETWNRLSHITAATTPAHNDPADGIVVLRKHGKKGLLKMLKKWFTKKQPVRCWVIKQIDHKILHLCGMGTLITELTPAQSQHQLLIQRYSGAVQMGDTGIVLHSQLFSALVPEENLTTNANGTARWQETDWDISLVPQRCWTWTGGLVAQPNPSGNNPRWVSSEDVTELRRKLDDQQHVNDEAAFRAQNDLEAPEKDVVASIKEAQANRRRKDAWGWHNQD